MRASGILMPVFSLPGPYGIGTLGNEAFAFVDFLAAAKQTYWQILPIGPTGYGDSPYQSFSAFAGNPYFIDFRLLAAEEPQDGAQNAPAERSTAPASPAAIPPQSAARTLSLRSNFRSAMKHPSTATAATRPWAKRGSGPQIIHAANATMAMPIPIDMPR